MADCIAWENVLIYNYSFGKTNIREIGSRNTLEERMDKVSGISDIHHFYDRMDAGGRSEFTGVIPHFRAPLPVMPFMKPAAWLLTMN